MNERKFLIRNVKKARDLISGKLKITPKDKTGDLVTNFDTTIEKFLIKKIKRTYPDFEIVSEEFNSRKKLTKNCFVIDPIDGTNNFARKIPLWGIQMACIKNGDVVASVIYLPIFEELYSADKTGAYLNDDKIHVNQQNEKIGVYSIEQSIPQVYDIQTKNRNSRLFGSAAFTLSMVACGKTSAAMFKDTIHPWDLIPGEYLVQKAGGVSFVSNHIRVCANSTSWANLLVKSEKTSPKKKPVEKNEEPTENPPVFDGKENELDELIKEKSEITAIEITNEPEPTAKTNKPITISDKNEPEFFIEESETILETFAVEIPDSQKPEVPSLNPIEKNNESQSKKININDIPKSTIRPNLTEARKRKIIM